MVLRVLTALLGFLLLAGGGARVVAEAGGKLLLQESFDTTLAREGATYTQPVVLPADAKAPGGRVVGPAELVDGPAGKALRLHGTSQVSYPPGLGPVDLAGGEASFSVALGFDPAEKTERTRTVLRNQLFLTFMGPGGSRVCVYTCLTDLCVLVQNQEGNLVVARNCLFTWKPNAWHQMALRWGTALELWCDGEKRVSVPWEGLFGSIPAKPEEVSLVLGSLIGWAEMESEFALDDLVIRGAQPGQISRRPRMALPLLPDPPALDGKLNDGFWQRAARVTGFTAFDRKEMAAIQPVLYAAYTSTGVYLGLDAPLAGGRIPLAVLTERDAPIYNGEDSLETFLKPPLPDGAYCQFIASAAGTRLDARSAGGKADIGGYNPDWQVKTDSAPGRWTAEILIPFASLGVAKTPNPGDVWQANFCLDTPAGFSSAATWAFTAGDFTKPVYFGEMVFTGKERTLRQETFRGFLDGEPETALKLVGPFPPIVTVRGELLDGTGKSLFRHEMPLRDSTSTRIQPPPLTTGTYTLVVSAADEEGQSLFYQSLIFQTARALSLTVASYPYAGALQMVAQAKGLKEPVDRVVCTVRAEDGKTVGTVALAPQKDGSRAGMLKSDALPPGAYAVEAQALSAAGKALETAKASVRLFPRPSWWKNNLGIDHSVPPPFTPVREKAGAVSVWGRQFQFGGRVFPRQITSRKTPLLTAAPTLRLRAGGKTVDLAQAAITRRQASPDVLTLSGATRAGDLAVSWKSTVEFDGFSRFDVTLTPARPVKVDDLSLVLPLQKGLVRFLHPSSGASGNIVGFDKTFSSSFLPYVWLGNDDMGLSFFAESDQHWTPKNKQMLQVVAGAKSVVLRANLIAQACTLSKPVTFSFGLMPTPIRPIPEQDPYHYPSYSYRGDAVFVEHLVYPAGEKGLPREGTLEFRVRRSEERSAGNTEVFHLQQGKLSLGAYFLTPSSPRELSLVIGEKGVIAAKLDGDLSAFRHLALTWDREAVLLYVDGKRVARADPAPLEALFAQEGPGQLRFGCKNEWSGYTGIVVDDVRLSRGVRYREETFTPPAGLPARDADTLVLDPLEDTFRPDGQDARTAGGGVPSIGSRWVPAHTGRGLKLEVAPPRPSLQAAKGLGVNIISHWEWQEAMSKYYAQPVLFGETVPGLKEEVAATHKAGIRVIPYAAYPAVGAPSQLVDQFGDEWGIRPLSTLPWQMAGAPEGYHLRNCCVQAKGFADYLVGGAAWCMDRFGFDGIYTDGITHVYACQNRAHGCGYVDDEGNLHSTWPIFATREAVKRLYRAIKSRHPDGFLVNHASFNYLMPTLSFSDILYTGEHEDYENLLMARVRFSSRPWGLFVTTLGSSEHIYSPLHTMASLLHGASIWGSGLVGRNDFARKEARIWQAYKAFGTRTATWVPYTQGEGRLYRPADPKVKASLYYHSGRDVLMVLANLNADAKDVALRLDLARLGLRGKTLRARNVLTDVALPLSPAGDLSVGVNGKSFVLLRVDAR